MKKSLLFGLGFVLSMQAQAQLYSPAPVTGFNHDVIANGTGSASNSTTLAVDAVDFNLVASDFVSPTGQRPTSFLPANGIVNSAATTGLTFQLAPYTGNNSLRLTSAGSGTLTLVTPKAADQVFVLGFSGSGASTATITVTFTDNTTQVFSSQSFKDWYNGTGFAMQGIGRVNRVTNAIENLVTNPRLYQIPLTLSAANKSKLIKSVRVVKSTSTTGVLNVLAISTKAVAPTIANDLAVTAISGLTSGCNLSAPQDITVTIANQGSATQSNFAVEYKIDNQAPVTATIPGPLASLATTSFTFPVKANLSGTGTYTITAKTNLTNDSNTGNDARTLAVTNAMQGSLPLNIDFETNATGLPVLQTQINPNAGLAEATAASSNATGKGLIMDGRTSTTWAMPVTGDPWTQNPDHLATAKMCINPAGGNASDPLWLSFKLKQLYKNANANTNFRVLVNGVQVGTTYRPPFSGTPIAWQQVNVNLTSYKNLPMIEIAFESNVMEAFNNGAGTANLLDDIQVLRRNPTGTKNELAAQQVTIFPNPSSGAFTLTAPFTAYQLEITDLTGKIILQQKATTKQTLINLPDAAKGIYLLKISDGKSLVTRKLVKE